MSSVVSFAEESCWDGESFRSIRRPIIFKVRVKVAERGAVDFQFTSDFGVFFDPEDDWLIDQLKRNAPVTNWERLIYWKAPDHSRIDLVDPDTDEKVGVITPRGYGRQTIDHEALPEGVTSLAAWRKNLDVEGGRNDSTEG